MWSKLTASILGLMIASCAAFPIDTYEAKPMGADVYYVKLTTGRASSERHAAEFAKRISATCHGAPKQVSDKKDIIEGLCADCDSMKLLTTATITCESVPA